MRRADRLFQMVQFLRKRHRAVTARAIGEEFGVCTRTVYRDIQDLIGSGVPVVGEAGVGYLMDKRYLLPPMMFDIHELEALMLGIGMVKNWTDREFAAQAANAQKKIQAVLTPELLERMQQLVLYAMPSCSKLPWQVSFSGIRQCILDRRKLEFSYTDERGRATTRTVRPLAMVFFGPVWLLAAWCEKRCDFRNFRLDRIGELELTQEIFADEPGKTLPCYIDAMQTD